MSKKDIKNFTLEELKEIIVKMDEPVYRAEQIFYWLYQKWIINFDEMNNIPYSLRNKLNQNYYISTLELSEHIKSIDKTEKFLFKLSDGNFTETVLISTKNRKTVCISTQVGCKFNCGFCASGQIGFVRNLTQSEILNQILFLQHNLKKDITNCVFMGMGEPLDNYENVSKAIIMMNDPKGMNIGARRITISTCGIVPGIEKLKDLGIQVNLSVSLHSANNNLRNELMPINKHYPLERLIKACEKFIKKTGRIITLEYVLIGNKNDSLQEANAVAQIARKLKAKVNLIPWSSVANMKFQPSQKKDIDMFVKRLINKGIKVTMRESKGKDIKAACGQLAGKVKNEI